MKDEGPFILEWIAHHRAIGFEQIIVFTNDCTDGTVRLLKSLEAQGYCTHRNNRVKEGENAQPRAYTRLSNSDLLDQSGWVMVLDADEFLNIHVGDGQLSDLLANVAEDTDLLTLCWRVFGDSDYDAYAPDLTTSRFRMATESQSTTNFGVKSLVRDWRAYERLGNHCPYNYKGMAPLVYQTASGAMYDLPHQDRGTLHKHLLSLPAHKASHKWAQINHYATRTLDSYILRQKRGLGFVGKKEHHTFDYFKRMNRSKVLETSFSRYDSVIAKGLAEMRKVPSIRAAEQNCLEIYQSRIDALMVED